MKIIIDDTKKYLSASAEFSPTLFLNKANAISANFYFECLLIGLKEIQSIKIYPSDSDGRLNFNFFITVKYPEIQREYKILVRWLNDSSSIRYGKTEEEYKDELEYPCRLQNPFPQSVASGLIVAVTGVVNFELAALDCLASKINRNIVKIGNAADARLKKINKK